MTVCVNFLKHSFLRVDCGGRRCSVGLKHPHDNPGGHFARVLVCGTDPPVAIGLLSAHDGMPFNRTEARHQLRRVGGAIAERRVIIVRHTSDVCKIKLATWILIIL